MSDWSRSALEADGFTGWVPFAELTVVRPPRAPGVYVVLRAEPQAPVFLERSVGGWFKGLDPSVALDVLALEWVTDASIVYIGKATSLRSRLDQYRKFGEGKAIGHRGGRYIWQLADSADLLVAWKETPDELPNVVESRMIADFRSANGDRRPFANLKD
jgi:hypothetical protein